MKDRGWFVALIAAIGIAALLVTLAQEPQPAPVPAQPDATH